MTEQTAADASCATIGRPPKDPASARYWEGELNQLLAARLPELTRGNGRIDVKRLSQATGNAKYTVYRWLILDHLSVRAAVRLVELSRDPETKEPTVSLEELSPFLFS